MPIHTFTLGDFTGRIVQLTGGTRDMKALLPSVDEAALAAGLAPFGETPEAGGGGICLLVLERGEQRLMVDTGMPIGDETPDRVLQRDLGIDPASITHIVLTHAHRDHIGGIFGADGAHVYPNARYTMSAAEWQYWAGDANYDAIVARMGEEGANRVRAILRKVQEHTDLLTHDGEILPGVRVLSVPGHTIGQLAVVVESQGEMLIHMADAAHHPVQLIFPDWTTSFDSHPEQSPAARRKVMAMVGETGWIMAYHFPFPALGRLVGGVWQGVQSVQGN